MLTLEKLAPYLPYGLKMIDFYKGYKKPVYFDLDPVSLYQLDYETVKPILRPLSDLTKRIKTEKNFGFIVFEFAINYGLEEPYIDKVLKNGSIFIKDKNEKTFVLNGKLFTYFEYQQCFKYHFDVFGMIESGEAIDINTLNK